MAKRRILIADKDHRARQQVQELLERQGLQVDVVTTAALALKRVQIRVYDAIFLGQEIPRIGRLELTERIVRRYPNASVVLLGDSHNNQFRRHAVKRGALYCLATPVSRDMLEIVVQSCLERTHLLRQVAELQRKTIQDDLTTTFNRRYLDAYLDEELDRVRRYRRTLSILFFDLDHLKDVNDRHGHLAGSLALRELAQLVKGKLRKSDRIFRYGGDEFVVTLPETGAEGAFCVAHRLRRLVRSHRFLRTLGRGVRLTASFGVATFPEDGAVQKDLIRAADQAMYRVKTRTRDGVASRSKIEADRLGSDAGRSRLARV
ncbi:MAG: diguanylate cyclase [Nitrospirota bacterium]|nr:diguanylate cyclase [Nitrospirota bacterium]